MKHYVIIITFLASVVLSGCSLKNPQTADEYRQVVGAGAFLTKVDTYEVDRPMSAVAKAFKKKASKCLDMTITSTVRSSRMNQITITDYKSTVLVGKNRVELHLQQHMRSAINLSNEPPGGSYVIVADATPLKKGKTLMKVYGPSMAWDNVTKAIKGWATGKNMGCPDLTK
ncbi:MAG: hypothetical protein KAR83_02465 [Thermodesulfovibrionales bacterium]|nr:hypothetical protein [Thermodesulfovibrionales bacterium]